jgi:excisionase family DNA binding protein
MAEIQINGKTYTPLSDLAESTHYNYDYLRRIAKAGKVDAVQIGSAWLINRDDLNRYAGEVKNRGPHNTPQATTA